MGSRRRSRRRSKHDVAWRKFLSSPAVLRELIEGFVPDLHEPLEGMLGFARAELGKTSPIESSMRGMESDLVWKIPLAVAHPPCCVHPLIEHQSTPQAMMAVRVLRHGRLALRHVRGTTEASLATPPVRAPAGDGGDLCLSPTRTA